MAAESQTFRFGEFELDLGAHQLRMRGEPVRLERRPLELLILLVSQHGKLVPRDEIIRNLWPGKVVIDFDTGLNTLVRKVRHALGDSPERPTYIETVAGLGYRFIGPVDVPAADAVAVSATTASRRWPRGLVYTVILVLAVTAALTAWRLVNRESPPISIAVLPFENLTGNDQFNYLAAGLAEETIASLARAELQNLRMIGQISGQAYAASSKPVPQIGRELGVDFVVASSLRAELSRIRVTSRLVRVSDNVQLWTATFDRELTSVLGLQRELSIAIAEQVRLRLSPDVSAAIERRQTLNPQAYDYYLRGRYEWSLLTPASSRRALGHFEDAIGEDPKYALAWAGMAQVLSTSPITGDMEPSVVRARAREAVENAIEFGADLPEVQYSLGYFKYFLDFDWPGAEAAFRRAVTLDPNSAIAHLMLGHVLSQTGKQAEAREMARRSRELDPLFSHTFALSAQIAFQARDFGSALEFARQAVAINPEGWIGYVNLGQVLAELGRFDEALIALDLSDRYSDGNSKAVAFRGNVLARQGRREEASAVAAKLESLQHSRYVPPYAIAMVYAGLGERDLIYQWLDAACDVRDVHLVFLPVDPRWDDYRGDLRFQSVMDRCPFDGSLEEPRGELAGEWTAAPAVIGGQGTITGLVTFTGPPGQMRQMGMCLVQRYGPDSSSVLCETIDDCDTAPIDLPAGASRYCVAPGNAGPKYCYFRPGRMADYCTASPALDRIRVAPGTYRVERPAVSGSQWLALSCFEACIASPMIVSESATVR